MISPLIASKAYAAVQGSAMPSIGGLSGGPQRAGGFGDMLKSVVADTAQTSRNAETQIAKHAAGKAELLDVVTAISSAESSLETVMAVRDQVISAYQEIMRMPI